MNRLWTILDEHEKGIQSILYHKRKDWEKRHLVWKQVCDDWKKQGKSGVPYPEPQIFPETIVRKNNPIHVEARVLGDIYEELKKGTQNTDV